jgi:hypothetical protein
MLCNWSTCAGQPRCAPAPWLPSARSNAAAPTQAWSRNIYDNSAIYGHVHGLIYSGAHNGEDAIVLYERAIPVIRSAAQQVRRLSNPALEFELLRIAGDHGMIVAP